MNNLLLLCALGIVMGLGLASFYRSLRRALAIQRLTHEGVRTHARVIEIKEQSNLFVEVNGRRKGRTAWREIVFFQARNGRYVRTSLPPVFTEETVTPVGRTMRIFYDPAQPRMAVHDRTKGHLPMTEWRVTFPAAVVICAGLGLGFYSLHSLFTGFFFALFPLVMVMRRAIVDSGSSEYFLRRRWEEPRASNLDDAQSSPPDYLFDPELYPAEDETLRTSLAAVGFADARSVIRPGVPGYPLSIDHPNPEEKKRGRRKKKVQPAEHDDAPDLLGEVEDLLSGRNRGEASAPEGAPRREEEPSAPERGDDRPAEPVRPALPTREVFARVLSETAPSELVPWMMRQAAGLYHRELFAVNGERPADEAHPTLPSWVTYADKVDRDETSVWISFAEVLSLHLEIIDQRGRLRGVRVETDLGGQVFADGLRDALEAAAKEHFPEGLERCAVILTVEYDEKALEALP